MVKPPKKLKEDEIKVETDGWDRFQVTMDKIVPPKRKPSENDKTSSKLDL